MMEQHLFILLFITGFAPLVLSAPHMYYLIQQGKTWSDAQTYCRATYTDLAVIKSNDDIILLQNEAQRQQFSSSAWIGLYNDVNSWRWSLGNETLGGMRNWGTGQPNNLKGNQECAGIAPYGWNDLPCAAKCPFVCYDDTKSGNQKYIYISNNLTWPEAQSYCRHYHTDLASARDATENSLIKGLVSELTWFGLFRDSWKWTDQTKFFTISWMSGKPNNALGNENCGYLNNSQAADAQCSDIMPFFCYSVITGKKEIIKIKIQLNPDVNDPAAKSAIFEQIKQKLTDHSMAENVTLKWREQPDGVVFQKMEENNILHEKKTCVFESEII